MTVFLVVLHVVVCVALIMIVLLQTGKGADMGAAFGGGASHTLFGSTGASTFLGKATTVAAIVFMLTSLALAYVSSHRGAGSIVEETPVASEQPAPAPADTAQTPEAAKTEAAPAEATQAAAPADAAQTADAAAGTPVEATQAAGAEATAAPADTTQPAAPAGTDPPAGEKTSN